MAQFTILLKIGGIPGEIVDLVLLHGFIGEPQKAIDFAVRHLLEQTVALGFGGSSADVDGITFGGWLLWLRTRA